MSYDEEHTIEILDQSTGQHKQKQLNMSNMDAMVLSGKSERLRSFELLEELRRQGKTSTTLRRSVIGLCVFAVLLAVANVGTSFATVMIIKNTKVSTQGDLTNLQGMRLGTTSKYVAFEISPIPENNRRLSRRLQSLVCGELEGTTKECSVQGQIMMADAVLMYQQFCPQWPTVQACTAGGVSSLLFTCQGKTSAIYGGAFLPAAGPSNEDGFTVFPAPGQSYYGQQVIQYSSSTSGLPSPTDSCVQSFSTAMYCPTEDTASSPCFVFAAWDTTECAGSAGVEICAVNLLIPA